MQNDIVTVVDGVGIVVAANDLAHFTLTLKAKGETLDDAKKQLEAKTKQAFKVLENLQDKGMKVNDNISSSLSNYKLEHREGRIECRPVTNR